MEQVHAIHGRMLMRAAVHLVASPTEIFYSQLSFFRYALRKLGYSESDVRIRIFIGDHIRGELPARWRPYMEGVEIIWSTGIAFERGGIYAQCDASFADMDAETDVTVFCDADTFWVKRLDGLFAMVANEAVCAGLMAHGPPANGHGPPPNGQPRARAAWSDIFGLIGRMAPAECFPYSHSRLKAPFYVNFGFVALSTRTFFPIRNRFVELSRLLRDTKIVHPYFSYQAGLTLALYEAEIPRLSLPLEFNFPNDDHILALHTYRVEDISVMHYLRTTEFVDRGKLFGSEEAFCGLLTSRATGADAILRDKIRELTSGRYPFSAN